MDDGANASSLLSHEAQRVRRGREHEPDEGQQAEGHRDGAQVDVSPNGIATR